MLLLLCLVPASLAETVADSGGDPVLTIDPDGQFAFAEKYFLRGDYTRAIGEYHRFVHFFPKDSRAVQAGYRIGMAHYRNGDFADAIMAFESVLDRHKGAELRVRSSLMVSECYLKLDRPGSAIANLQNLITISDETQVKDEANYRIAWIYLETASWQRAESHLERISADNRSEYRLEQLGAGLAQRDAIKKKSPRLSGLLSAVPGLGYLYLERYRDALTSLVVNCGVAYAAYESFDDDRPALGGVLALVGTGFYAGNVYGAVSSARQYNRIQTNRFIERLKANTRIEVSPDLVEKGAMISLRYVF